MDLDPATIIGKTIDCITDADNKVVVYEFILNKLTI